MKPPLLSMGMATLGMARTGCVVPWPHRTCLQRGLSGEVVDATSGRPVMGVDIEVRGGYGSRTTLTDTRGRFRTPAIYRQQWALLLGPTTLSLPGGGGVMTESERILEIRHWGYHAQSRALKADETRGQFRLERLTRLRPPGGLGHSR